MKNWLIKDRIDDQTFIDVCNSANSMAHAAAELNLHFNSFKKRALELNCYKPNQPDLGLRKKSPKIPIEDIIHPQYQSYKLRKRLLEENIMIEICGKCSINSWNEMPISLELHHIDGNRTNHHIDNLMLLCPNCHSQTDNFRAKNKKN